MRFTELQYQTIQLDMSDADLSRALSERYKWLEENKEGLSIYQKYVLKACLNYVKENPVEIEKTCSMLNNIFAIALNTIGNDKTFFDNVEFEFMHLYDPVLGRNYRDESYKSIIEELNKQRNFYIYALETDKESDMSKAIKGFQGSVTTAASFWGCMYFVKGDYRNAFILFAALKFFNEVTSKKRCLEPSATANMVYHAPSIVKRGMAAISDYVPANLLVRFGVLFSSHINKAVNKAGISAANLPIIR